MEALIKRGAACEKETVSEENNRPGTPFWPEKGQQQEKMNLAAECCGEVFTSVDELWDITEDTDVTEDMSKPLNTSGSLDVEFDENELQAELERLEKNVDDMNVLSSPSRSLPAKTEEEKEEEELEYLQCWASETS